MQSKLLITILFTLCFSSLIFAQQNSSEKLFEVRGIVKDQEKSILAGLNLYFENDNFKKTTVTDESGIFSLKLPVGKYKIIVNEATSKKFVAFIEIPNDRPYPTDFELTVELNSTCCSQTSGGKPTEVVKYIAPVYPPAAKATHSSGEVIVTIKIDKDGKVVAAEAVAGHPLLKQAAIQAAKLWLFSFDKNSTERDGTIIFAFVPLGNSDSTITFKNPNRLEIRNKQFFIENTIDY